MTFLHTHHHGHDHAHDHVHEPPSPGLDASRSTQRLLIAALVLATAIAAACLVMVEAGQAVVITRFGDPVRVVTRPGLTWRIPSPIEDTVKVDLRLRTT
ncbi:MAG TPA: SPFH domain-containing protein, partial [Xanthobacteraceae bacterium]|nr:SPFH domain-containing protein [Xanthobacteraceae bacterium]